MTDALIELISRLNRVEAMLDRLNPLGVDLYQETWNPALYGAALDGVTDDTQAWADMIGEMPSTGGAVLLPVGTSLVSTISLSKPIRLVGESRSGSIIMCSSATADMITVDAAGCSIEHLKVTPNAGVVRTAGSLIRINGTNCILEQLYAQGISSDTGGALIRATSLATYATMRNLDVFHYTTGILLDTSLSVVNIHDNLFEGQANGNFVADIDNLASYVSVASNKFLGVSTPVRSIRHGGGIVCNFLDNDFVLFTTSLAVSAGVSRWSIIDNRFISVTTGVLVSAGASDDYTVIGNDFTSSVTTPITDGGTGLVKVKASNLPLSVNDAPSAYRFVVEHWYVNNLNGTTGPTAMLRDIGLASSDNPSSWLAVRAGTIVGLAVHSNAARTAGTCTITLLINGVAQALTAVLDGTNTTFKASTGSIAFVAGDLLSLTFTTVGWLPTNADIKASIEVLA